MLFTASSEEEDSQGNCEGQKSDEGYQELVIQENFQTIACCTVNNQGQCFQLLILIIGLLGAVFNIVCDLKMLHQLNGSTWFWYIIKITH